MFYIYKAKEYNETLEKGFCLEPEQKELYVNPKI